METITWAEVDLDAIAEDVRNLKAHVGSDTMLMAVVKANAYGHGAVPVARAALEAGADRLAVNRAEEGVALRKAGIDALILLLGPSLPSQAEAIVEHGLTPTVISRELATALNDAGRVTVHVKVDTGMGRFGIMPEEAPEFFRFLHTLPNLYVEGIFTHFAVADLAGWTSNHGMWTNPGDHMHGEYATGNAWNMRAENGSDFVYEGTVNLLSGNAVGLTFRSSADGTSSYHAILDAVDGVFKISKRPPYTVLASYHMTVQRNHPYRIQVVAHGNQIEAYLDGVKRLTVTDSTYPGGRFGVVLFHSTADYDDLAAWRLP